MTPYHLASVAKYFDEFGEREWTRLVESPAAEVQLYVHSHYLQRYLSRGD